MAVYKPNYCYPYLEPVDLTIPDGEKYFTCQIDTSNIAITGYKIEVYDENNTLVFPHKDNKNKISPVSELPIVTNIDGLNGSELRIPFIQHYYTKITASYNAIYFKVTKYVDYYQLEPLVKEGREFKIGDNDQLCVKEKDSQTYEPMVIDGSLIFVGDTILAKDQLYTVTTSGVAAAPALTEIDIIYVKSGYTYAGSIFQYKNEKWVESTDGVWVDCDEHQLSLSNKGKTYKWQITLYSGSKGAAIEPKPTASEDAGSQKLVARTINYDAMADSEFDTLLTSGTILGSTEDRIQGPISDKIYAKQWLQLLRKNDKGDWLQVGTRTYIESYSQSLGHIYPISGGSRGFSNDDLYGVNPATHFAVYKYSNDPEHMTSQNSVDQSINFELTASGASYTKENYSYEVTGEDDIATFNNKCKALNTTPLCNYKYDEQQDSYTADYGGQSVLIWNEHNSKANPLTGYFTINFTTSQGSDGKNIPKFTFLMAYAYRKISSYIGKVFFVKDGSFMNQNIVSKAEATGDNNILSLDTPIIFTEEEPLEIYPDAPDATGKLYGEIYKNSAGKVYVSPFVGLQAGARLYVSDGSVIKATSVDSTTWAVEYNTPQDKVYFSTDPLKYEIRTNFKSSDETPFYAYDSPRLVPWGLENLAVANEHGHEFLLESGGEILTVPILCSQKVDRRYIEVGGQYLQAQNKSWTSYRWLLVDAYGNIIQDTGKQYDGAIKTTFYGLDGPTPKAVEQHQAIPNVYYIVLIVEDELGNVLLMGIKIEVTINPTKLIAQFSGEFDCKTHSVKLGIQDYGYPALSKDKDNTAIKLGDADGVVTSTEDASSYVGLQGVDKGENDAKTPSWKATSKMALPLEGAQLKRFFKYQTDQIDNITQNPSKMVANKEGNIEFHTQVELDANFCGDIFTYVVDIGDRFGNTDKLRISLALPENFLTLQEDVTQSFSFNPSRNRLKCTVKNNYTMLDCAGLSMFPLATTNKEAFYLQPASWADSETGDLTKYGNTELEYLNYPHPFNPNTGEELTGYTHINDSINTKASREIGVCCLQSQPVASPGQYNVWTDLKRTQIETPAGFRVVQTQEPATWDDTKFWVEGWDKNTDTHMVQVKRHPQLTNKTLKIDCYMKNIDDLYTGLDTCILSYENDPDDNSGTWYLKRGDTKYITLKVTQTQKQEGQS